MPDFSMPQQRFDVINPAPQGASLGNVPAAQPQPVSAHGSPTVASMPSQNWMSLLTQAPTPGDMLNQQKADRADQGRNALAQLYQDPNNVDPNGGLKPEAIAKLYAGGHGDEALKVQSTQGEIAQHQQQLATSRQKAMTDWQHEMITTFEPATVVREDVYKKTGSEEAAQRAAQDKKNEIYDRLVAEGSLTPERKRILDANRTYNYQTAKANLIGYKGTLDQQKSEAAEKRAEADEGRAAVASQRSAEDKPQNVEIIGPDGKKTTVLASYNKDTGQWLTRSATGEKSVVSPLREVGVQGAGNPTQQLLNKYFEEHPDATAEDAAKYVQSTHAPRSAAGMTLQKYMQENPNASSSEVASFMAWNRTRGAAEQAFAVGVEGRATRSIDVAIDHLGSMTELVKALNNNDTNVINRVANFVKTELGLDSAPITFEAARSIVGSEIVKAVQGGASALGDRAEARGPIDPKLSPQQLLDVIAEDKRLMAGQLRGLEQQYVSSVVAPDKRGDKEAEQRAREAYQYKLFPETRGELGRAHTPGAPAEKGKEGAAPPPGAQPPAGAPVINSKAQYDALPSHAQYRKPGDPDGYARIKP